MPRPRTVYEENAYRAGAREEARQRVHGMTESGKGIYEAVETLAQQGYDSTQIAGFVNRIYLTGLPLSDRVRIAYRLLRRRS